MSAYNQRPYGKAIEHYEEDINARKTLTGSRFCRLRREVLPVVGRSLSLSIGPAEGQRDDLLTSEGSGDELSPSE